MHDPVSIAAVAFLVGMASNASRPAVQAMMACIVLAEDRVRAFSLNYWAINLGFAVSSMAAGFIASFSYLAGFLIEAGMTLACALLVFAKLPESPAGAERQGGEDDVGLGTVLRDRRFMSVCRPVLPRRPGLPAGLRGTPRRHGQSGLHTRHQPHCDRRQRRPHRRAADPGHPFHPAPGSAPTARDLLGLAGYGFGLTAFAGSVGVFALTVCVWTLAKIVNAPTQMGLVVQLSPTHGRGRYQGMYTLSWSLAALIAPDVRGGHRPVRPSGWWGCAHWWARWPGSGTAC